MIKKSLYGIDTKVSAEKVKNQVITKIKTTKPSNKTFKNSKFLLSFATLILTASMVIFIFTQVTPKNERSVNTTLTDNLSIKITPLTKEDIFLYKNNRVSEAELINDYKVFYYQYTVSKTTNETNLTIEHSQNWIQVINNIDGKERYANGTGWNNNNEQDSTVQEEFRFIFNTKDLTNEQIISAFEKYTLKISWQTDSGKNNTKVINIDEHIKFIY